MIHVRKLLGAHGRPYLSELFRDSGEAFTYSTVAEELADRSIELKSLKSALSDLVEFSARLLKRVKRIEHNEKYYTKSPGVVGLIESTMLYGPNHDDEPATEIASYPWVPAGDIGNMADVADA